MEDNFVYTSKRKL